MMTFFLELLRQVIYSTLCSRITFISSRPFLLYLSSLKYVGLDLRNNVQAKGMKIKKLKHTQQNLATEAIH